jgi:hypothetical protein
MTRVNGRPAATIETGTVTWTVVAEGKRPAASSPGSWPRR